MFWRNAATWSDDTALIDALRVIEQQGGDDLTWEIRQTVWVKGA
jgi:hypothetical protein